MSSSNSPRLRRAQRRIDNSLEKGLGRANAKHEAATEKLERKIQRAKYNTGAAKSPTPPPRKSITRDRQAIEIFKIIEAECYDRQGVVPVEGLAEKFLFEQCLIAENKLTAPAKTNDALIKERDDLRRRGDVVGAKVVQRRLMKRLKRLNGMEGDVKIYGWDKCTFLLKSCFISWAISPKLVVPFTVNLSETSVRGAKNAKAGFASHLQSRLHNILRRRFDGEVPEFWFMVEQGTANGFHLHGAIACGHDRTSKELAKHALQTFSGLESHKAVHLGAPGKRLGWAKYCLKHALKTQQLLGEATLFACTAGAKREGREFYKAFREELRTILKAA
ncbi:MAG: hypothetical protein RLN72_16510 [Henriciella sp.]